MFCSSYFCQQTTQKINEQDISRDYRVWINGQEIPVYSCRVSKYPFNIGWPGHQRSIEQSEKASYINLVSDESLQIRVKTSLPFERVMIKPYSKQIESVIQKDEISFTMENNGYLVLCLNDGHHCLHIFNNAYVPCEDKSKVTYYFGAGIHFARYIRLKDNESVYLEKDALVYGNIFAENAKNVKIYGNGVIDDGMEERVYCGDWYGPSIVGNIKLIGCENVEVKGVGFKNSACWCVNVFNCKNVQLDGVKVFGQWRYNTDGIDICNCEDVCISNSFIRSFDDGIVIKGLRPYRSQSNRNILVKDCVVWCDWGRALELGLETYCKEYDNITFENCDVLRGATAVLDIQNGDIARIHNVTFKNIYAEYNDFDSIAMIQGLEDDVYWGQNMIDPPILVNIVNQRCSELYPDGYDENDETKFNAIAKVEDIWIQDIYVYYDERIDCVDGKQNVRVRIQSLVEGTEFENIYLKNIKINGRQVLEKDLITTIEKAKNVKIQ